MNNPVAYTFAIIFALAYNFMLRYGYKKGYFEWSDSFQLFMAYVGVILGSVFYYLVLK